MEEATATFTALQARYPDSEDGQSALFSLVRAAMEVGRFEVASEAFAKMKASPDQYSPAQLVRVGQLMLDAGRFAEAADAFAFIAASGTRDREVLERALYGLGRARFETGAYREAAEAMERLLDEYPLSGLFYEAKFALGRAYRLLDEPDRAVEHLNEVFRYGREPLVINRASMELARIQESLAEAAAAAGRADEADEERRKALASYQRVAMFADSANADLAPLVREALVRSIRISLLAGRYADAVNDADAYLERFPGGPETEDVRRWKAEARLKAASAGGGGAS
jgi:tetratricopeptide (TPR) repeat protein